MEETKQEIPKMRVKVVTSAKGGKYGEYTFRGDTEDELRDNGKVAKKLFDEHVGDEFVGDTNDK